MFNSVILNDLEWFWMTFQSFQRHWTSRGLSATAELFVMLYSELLLKIACCCGQEKSRISCTCPFAGSWGMNLYCIDTTFFLQRRAEIKASLNARELTSSGFTATIILMKPSRQVYWIVRPGDTPFSGSFTSSIIHMLLHLMLSAGLPSENFYRLF